ncbi:MAG: GGDEF domain-containing protein [Nitrospinota bacterium]
MAPEELDEEGWPVPEPEREAVPADPEEAKTAPGTGESAFLMNLLSPPSHQALSPLAELEGDDLIKAFLSGGPSAPRLTALWFPPAEARRLPALLRSCLVRSVEEVTHEIIRTLRDNPPHLLLIHAKDNLSTQEVFLQMAFEKQEARRPMTVLLVPDGASPLLASPPAWADAVLPLSLPDPSLGLNLERLLRLALTRHDLEMIFLAHRVSREQLHRVTFTDPLTGLTNRAGFNEMSAREISRVSRTKGSLGLVILDIDHFKKINDTYGHPAGDSVLRELARILRRETRALDQAIRFGGEEFGLLLPHTDYDEMLLVAERIRQEVEKAHFEAMPKAGAVTISLGALCIYSNRRASMADMYKMCDELLYQAKQGGRNRVVSSKHE